ncbi:SRPBCC family protein [Azospirillum sp. SYSU D00513]|uniref:aromatic ring-hydroxylating oxygenase subunit alpha n=1 Tax=Azospirillum sp. SYSU D00513 TaxID=2812561 RepID=UPI001A965768|nr:SRPBCC family protein [Azospirillum sp. SYSU D00513]
MPFIPVKAAPGLVPAAYRDASIFADEQDRIFRRGWIFACLRDEVANHNDYVVRRVGGMDVVVQNFDGAVRAFQNVCTHRFGLIRSDACGNGPLRCRYHGWTFDREGVPVGMPGHAANFGLDEAGRRARALRPVELEACGDFLFLRVEPGGPGLEEHLGGCAALLRHLSEIFGTRVDEQVLPWEANWKFGVENVLEVYHADTVHPDTFRRFVQKDWRCSYDGPHSRGTISLSEDSARWWDKAAKLLALRPSPDLREYEHLHVFPNLEIAVTRGTLMSVQSYDPAGPERCELRLRLYFAHGDRPDLAGRGAWTAFADTARTQNLRLLGEDREVAEQAALGARQVDFPSVLGLNEERIQHFQSVYSGWMGGGDDRG